MLSKLPWVDKQREASEPNEDTSGKADSPEERRKIPVPGRKDR